MNELYGLENCVHRLLLLILEKLSKQRNRQATGQQHSPIPQNRIRTRHG